jgi:hypothetical protein
MIQWILMGFLTPFLGGILLWVKLGERMGRGKICSFNPTTSKLTNPLKPFNLPEGQFHKIFQQKTNSKCHRIRTKFNLNFLVSRHVILPDHKIQGEIKSRIEKL